MKKLLSVIFSALLVSVMFSGCTATKTADPTDAPVTLPPAVNGEIQQSDTNGIQATTPIDNLTNSSPLSEPEISKDKAKEIALKHAGLTETEISRYKSELDWEREALVYEIEFDSGNYEYDYEIDATSGAVIKSEKDLID